MSQVHALRNTGRCVQLSLDQGYHWSAWSKSPCPVENKTAKADSDRKRGLVEILEAQLSQSRAVNKKNCVTIEQHMEFHQLGMEKQVEMQQGLSLAISLLSHSFQRSNYTEGSAAAIATEDLEITEIELKRREIEMKTTEMVLKTEESRLKLLALQRSQSFVVATEVEITTATMTAMAMTETVQVVAAVATPPIAVVTAIPGSILWPGTVTP